MRITTLIAASLALVAMSSSAYALDLSRCQNLPDQVTIDNAPVNRVGIANSSLAGRTIASGQCQTLSGRVTVGTAGTDGICLVPDSLSEKAPSGYFDYVTYDGLVADILMHQDGTVDVKDSLKAYAAAVLAAIKAGNPIPKPGPEYEVVDWNAPTEGSHC